jgi:hypothetical protein
MRVSVRSSFIALAALGSVGLAAPAAWAGCGDTVGVAPASWDGAPARAGDPRLIKTAVTGGAQSIVGLWDVKFYVGGNLFDFGYAAWHDDGTEIMNSGGRSPASENFCMGVWTATGPFSYVLNHYALSYDPASGKLNGKVVIRETVQVDGKGQSFSGPFTLDVFDPSTNANVAHVAGQVSGKRLTAQ